MKKQDNRGFSLVELIIVIAIMGIIIVMLAGSLNYIGNSQARSLANSIKTAVGQTRIQTMGKYETYLYIYKGSDGKYYRETWKKAGADAPVRENREMIGKNKPIVKYYVDGDASAHTIDGGAGHALFITFDRSNGKEIVKSNPLPAGSTDTDGNAVSGMSTVRCNKIEVSYGTLVYTIDIVPDTGKVSL